MCIYLQNCLIRITPQNFGFIHLNLPCDTTLPKSSNQPGKWLLIWQVKPAWWGYKNVERLAIRGLIKAYELTVDAYVVCSSHLAQHSTIGVIR